jgi:protocatechuate 3,4-dioxygenase beta subunit
MDGDGITRRESLLKLGGLAAGALGAGAFLEESAGGGPDAVAAGLVSCVLAPEFTAGPFALDGDKVRRDIRAGRPGLLLTLRTTVLDVSSCKPIRGAAVDIWHCDAGGTYSGFAQEGTAGRTFLRGIQKTDASGLAVFKTIYPGWYPGRAVHIHVRVYVGGNVIHTGQLFFPDAVTDAVYRRLPYRRRPNRTTRNAEDSIFRNGGSRSLLRLTKTTTGYVGRITMGVSRR